jgi:hypothetical protein
VARSDTRQAEPTTAEIGHVLWNAGRSRLILWGRDDWTCEVDGRDVPALAGHFRQEYRGKFYGPQYGYYGQMLLPAVAKDLGGTWEMRPPVGSVGAGGDAEDDGEPIVY